MQHLDEGTIHAWLDGALSAEEAARTEAHVTSCPVCADAVAEARGLIAASSRILTALDDVPNVRGAGDAQEKRWKGAGTRRSITTWLVRERIAAVMALVVAGGALAVVLTRPTEQAAQVDLAAEPVRTFEVAAADSPGPPPAARALRADAPQGRGAGTSAVPVSPSAPARDLADARQAEASAPPTAVLQQTAPTVAMDAASSVARTDDSLRPVRVAEARREEAAEASAEGKSSSVAQKVTGALGRRRAAETQAAFADRPPVASPSVGGAAGAAVPSQGPRLVQDVTMTESGREVRRRIYMVDNVLVTLDERPAIVGAYEMRRSAANAAQPDSSATGTTTIQWTGVNGTELTLTGRAPKEQLERIKKALGY
jgi:putative zinc finger protein